MKVDSFPLKDEERHKFMDKYINKGLKEGEFLGIVECYQMKDLIKLTRNIWKLKEKLLLLKMGGICRFSVFKCCCCRSTPIYNEQNYERLEGKYRALIDLRKQLLEHMVKKKEDYLEYGGIMMFNSRKSNMEYYIFPHNIYRYLNIYRQKFNTEEINTSFQKNAL